MSTHAKSVYHHGNLKEALLEVADQVLEEKGLQGFTLRECARRAEVSHAAPKHHFGGMRGLLTCIATRCFNNLCAALSQSQPPSFATQLRIYTEFAQNHPEHFRVMFRSDLLDMTDQALQKAMYDAASVLLRSSAFNQPLDSPAHAKVLMCWAAIHGYAHLLLEQQLASAAPNTQNDAVLTALGRLLDESFAAP